MTMADPTPTPSPTPAPTPTPTPAPAAFDWNTSVTDEATRTWVQAKGFKDVTGLAQSALNLEKLTGDLNSIVRLPKADAADFDKQMGDVYTKLGRPEKPGEYKLPVPQGQDPKFAETVSTWFHDAGLNPKQAQALATKWNEHMGGATKAQSDAIAARDASQLAELKQTWGANYDANSALVEKAAQAFGMDQQTLLALRQTMGPGAAMKFMQNIGAKLGVSDTSFITGENRQSSFAGGMSPAEAKQRVAALRADPEWIKGYGNGDADKKAEMSKLMHAITQGGTFSV
jgi:hypothetical protein